MGLVGCAAPESDDGPASSSAAAEPEREPVSLRVAAPTALQGVLLELADAYAADKDWLSFDVQVYDSAKKENAAIAPVEAPAPDAAEQDTASSSAVSPGADQVSTQAAEAETVMLPAADIVFHSSHGGMDAAEKAGAADPATRVDMLQDGLAIVASADSKLDAVPLADIASGACPLLVVSGKSVHAKCQLEVLQELGIYADGAFTGAYVQAAGNPPSFETAADLFAALKRNPKAVALVRTSDIYRYGGVKVVGAVPSRMHADMRFPYALGMNLAGLENGGQVEESARSFLAWMRTDETALSIVEKWGFKLAS